MLILLISPNPLFSEAIEASFTRLPEAEIRSVKPEAAVEAMRAFHPQVVLVDENAPAGLIRGLVKENPDAGRVRLVILNCKGNEFTVLDSYHSTITSVDELIERIRK